MDKDLLTHLLETLEQPITDTGENLNAADKLHFRRLVDQIDRECPDYAPPHLYSQPNNFH